LVLGSGVLTTNKNAVKNSFAARTGSSFVNKLVVSDPRLPQVLKIAVTEEISSIRRPAEFVNTKTIWID
jgi:succinate-semialdehyde dehydrogenase/glutarate-semialdehyde dehydrogenase